MFRKLLFSVILLLVVTPAFAQTIDVERLANAIKLQENSYRHPFGILKSYCRPGDPDGQCRKGCIQSINKRLNMWKAEGEPGDFVTYLGKSYCPPDAHILNKYWVKGVTYFYKKGDKHEI